MTDFLSWGRYPKAPPKRVLYAEWRHELPAFYGEHTYLPYGLGRSYGDSCLNSAGAVIATRHLSRLISFDPVKGLLRCEAGVSLAEILAFAAPRGWFLPVSPGTKFVTVGGAIANDVHGKNHHRGGTFGTHVRGFELVRSDGSRRWCSLDTEQGLYRATIAGLGLTGLITEAEVQLRPIETPWIAMESIKFGALDEFFEISASSDADFDYTVAWLDCVASGKDFGRGIFMRGNHATREQAIAAGKNIHARAGGLPLAVPFDAPSWALNNLSVRAFNFLYYNKQRRREVRTLQHYHPFFYPLDAVHGWNRIYGKRGFLQFQCVVPSGANNRAMRAVLGRVVASGGASFLAVMKEFGELTSPGMLSFPRKGVTLCLDFANEGPKTIALFEELDRMVREFGGAMYPAKDACMAPQSFKEYYPAWKNFSDYIDPRFSSDFWRRVTA